MAAFANHTFEKGFLLDEERLRKINSILKTWAQGKNISFSYSVRRNDAFTFTTEDIEEVFSQDNTPSQKIVAIAITNKPSAQPTGDQFFRFSLAFDVKSGTQFVIQGEDRNSVFVLFSDIKEYVKQEVNTRRGYQDAAKAAGAALLVGSMVMMSLSIVYTDLSNPRLSDLNGILSGTEAAKLNFLILSEARRRGPRLLGVVALSLITLGGALLLLRSSAAWLTGILFPHNLFLIGKEKERFERLQGRKDKLLWGVFITLLLGVVAGLIVWALTKGR